MKYRRDRKINFADLKIDKLNQIKQLIHGFTISVPVLILPIFRQFLLRNGKISSKSLF